MFFRVSSVLVVGSALAVVLSACGGGVVDVGSNGSALHGDAGPGADPGASGGSGGSTCTVDGKTYAAGDSFPSADGCNTCSCLPDGNAVCTQQACAPGSGPPTGSTCTYGGTGYAAGDSFPSTDGCNTCSCLPGGSVVCSEKACAYTCPAPGPIDCMPAVPGPQKPECSGPYHDWIVANCPDVTFAL